MCFWVEPKNDGSEAIGTTEPRLRPWFCCNGRLGAAAAVMVCVEVAVVVVVHPPKMSSLVCVSGVG